MTRSVNTSLVNVAIRYSSLLQAKVSASSLRKNIEENPFYPSLYSLSNTFSRYHIDNDSFEIPIEKFDELKPPFISLIGIDGHGKDFVLVTEIAKNTVTYFYKRSKAISIDKEEFLKRYNNIVWVAEPNEQSGETEFHEKLREEKINRIKQSGLIAGAAMLVIMMITTGIAASASFSFVAITVLKLFGTAAAILLLIYETDKSNAFVKNICSVGKQTNCSAVLNSKAAKIKGISWGEIGFFYFAASILLLLVPGFPITEKIAFIAIGNALAVPYILFSIYYQWRIVKQWCTLCLTVQFILSLELVWSSIVYWQQPWMPSLQLVPLLSIAFSLLLPIVAWYSLKTLFIKARDHDLYVTAYKRLQYNPEMFKGLLQGQVKATSGWEELGITIGNPQASTKIIKVCNPYCGPCAKAHPILEELVNDNDIQLKIIFTTSNSDLDRGVSIVRHLLAIASEGDMKKTQQALDDWYMPKDKVYDVFSAKYPLNGELKEQGAKIEAMKNWCDASEIKYTPTLFINGYKMPENYSIEELKNIL